MPEIPPAVLEAAERLRRVEDASHSTEYAAIYCPVGTSIHDVIPMAMSGIQDDRMALVKFALSVLPRGPRPELVMSTDNCPLPTCSNTDLWIRYKSLEHHMELMEKGQGK